MPSTGPYSAQIQRAINALIVGNTSFSDLSVIASGYINFNTPLGASGYGFRDNAGTLEFKNSGGSWTAFGGGGGAPTVATYILQTANASLPNAQVLTGLGTGYVKNTTGTGALSVQTTPIPAGDGGTGIASYTIGSLILASGATTLAQLADVAVGQLLASGGVGVAPVYTATPTVTSLTASAGLAIDGATVGTHGIQFAAAGATPAITAHNLYSPDGTAIVFGSTTLTGNLGTVTSVSVTSANGVSGSVATATTTPAITLTLGAITPTSVNALTLAAAAVGFTIAGGTSSKTATFAGNFTTAHGDDLTLTTTGATNVTLPTSGTLLGTAAAVTLAQGGTGANLTASTGGILYSGASAAAILAGVATAGKIIRSGATAAPTWSTATYPDTAGTSGNVLTSDGTNWTSTAPTGGTTVKDVCNFRLTLETGVPVSTTDQSAKTTLYFTQFGGNQIGLYNGSSWDILSSAEMSITLVGTTASKPYDVFVYNNAGTATLEILVWTNTTTRATALVLQDGVWSKTGALTRRYVGTIYINSTGGQTDDTLKAAYIWNYYNPVDRPVSVYDAATSWTWATPGGVYRAADNSTSNSVTIITGLVMRALQLTAVTCGGLDDNNGLISAGIGIDSSTTDSSSSQSRGNTGTSTNSVIPSTALHTGYPALGLRQYRWLEYGNSFSGSGTATFYTTSAANKSGMHGSYPR